MSASLGKGKGLVMARSNSWQGDRPCLRLHDGGFPNRSNRSRSRMSNVLPFSDILDAAMVNSALASAGVTFKERISTPFVTLCMFLSQVLDPDHSCRAAVARLIVWLAVNHRKPCSPETNSYCDAR